MRLGDRREHCDQDEECSTGRDRVLEELQTDVASGEFLRHRSRAHHDGDQCTGANQLCEQVSRCGLVHGHHPPTSGRTTLSTPRSALSCSTRAVVHPRAVLTARDETGFAEHLQVVADRRLALAHRSRQFAGAHLAGRRRGDDAEQSKAHRISHGPEGLGQPLGRRSSSWSAPSGAQHEVQKQRTCRFESQGSGARWHRNHSIDNHRKCIDRCQTMDQPLHRQSSIQEPYARDDPRA